MTSPSIAEPAVGYAVISRSLRSRISRGELAPGARLPAMSDLAREHGTTPITVRRALRELEEEGLVRVEHGSGTFVTDWASGYDLPHLPSFAAELAARRLRPEASIVACRLEVAHPVAAAALGMPGSATLCKLTRLRRVEGVPFACQHSYVSAALDDAVAQCRADESLYERLRALTGRVPASARESVRAVELPAEAAALLEEAAGAPGLLSVRVTLDAAGQPLVYDEAWFPGGRVELRIHRRGGQSVLEFGFVS